MQMQIKYIWFALALLFALGLTNPAFAGGNIFGVNTPPAPESASQINLQVGPHGEILVTGPDGTTAQILQLGAALPTAATPPVPEPGFWDQFWGCDWSWCTMGNLLKVFIPLLIVFFWIRSQRRALAGRRADYGATRDRYLAYFALNPHAPETTHARDEMWIAAGRVDEVCWMFRGMPIASNHAVPAIVPTPNPATPLPAAPAPAPAPNP